MLRYYLSRFLVAWLFAALFYIAGASWWIALLVGLLATAWFLYAPYSGRYQVNPEGGVTALRRDERAQWINDKAARNAFVVLVLTLAGLNIYFGSILSEAMVPIVWTRWLLIAAVAVYVITDVSLRRR